MDESEYTQVNLSTMDKLCLRDVLQAKLDYYNSFISSLENQLKPMVAGRLRVMDLLSKVSH